MDITGKISSGCEDMATKALTCGACVCENPEDVLLLCGHLACKSCLTQSSAGSYQCPVCGGVSSAEDMRCSAAVRGRHGGASRQSPQAAGGEGGVHCGPHGESAKYFCLEEKRFLCDTCEDSKEHGGHKHCLIHEAALDLKRVLEVIREDLGCKLETLKDSKDACVHALEHIMHQAEESEDKIKEEFAKLHQFLWDEEASRIAALREEEEQKRQVMKDKIDKMCEEILSLLNTISDIEEEMGAEDAVPLQDIVAAGRVQSLWQHPEGIGPGELVNLAKHLGNLRFRIWEKMQDMVLYTPVILDPNTADARLHITADLTSVKISTDADHQPPDNPERYDTFACVLGSRGFASGTHSWTVEVDANTSWEVGVSSGAGRRKGEAIWPGVWSVEFWDEEYYVRSPGQQEKTLLRVAGKLRRVRVRLDWDGGELSFSDPVSGAHLLTVTHTFTETLYPFFYNGCDTYPLNVLPVRLRLVAED
ncbi:E3 ubiquitin-protein ligase TRIM35-like [Alosa sapidissima]|uniref:E3 ubiquitin-protein ligase TRIM35-like n=1 Tax=Alosa sapidissima TaxID=34773 RepID=UPI001C0A5ED3|nr:E3 ubiquitin-protein ligase TRIM35-like [Alosa sapidissima]